MKLHGGAIRISLVLAALVLLVGGGCSTDELELRPEPPGDVPTFAYELYCDGRGYFTYDGAALKLVRRPAHLEQVYADAGRGDARAREVVRELEEWFARAGAVVADTTTRPACLPLPELTPECQPNWQFLASLGTTREAERLRQVVAHAYALRARERGLRNSVIVEGINLLMAGGMAKRLMIKEAATEARAATPSIEAGSAQAEAQSSGREGIASKGAAGGRRSGKDFTPAGKRQIDAENATKNGGVNKCENCGTDVVPGQKSQRGLSPPSNQRERDHIIPKSQGGDGSPPNGQVLCRGCNLNKSGSMP